VEVALDGGCEREGFGGSGAASAPGYVDEERVEGMRHALETGVEVERSLCMAVVSCGTNWWDMAQDAWRQKGRRNIIGLGREDFEREVGLIGAESLEVVGDFAHC